MVLFCHLLGLACDKSVMLGCMVECKAKNYFGKFLHIGGDDGSIANVTCIKLRREGGDLWEANYSKN